MEGHAFLKPQTLMIFALGFLAISLDTVAGVLFGKLVCLLTGG
jgi:oxaloacetate decarboxylase beta subunit